MVITILATNQRRQSIVVRHIAPKALDNGTICLNYRKSYNH